MPIPSQREYEHREIALAHRQIDEVSRAPLADRKEAQMAFFEAMRDAPGVVGERVGWLLDGNYGYGSMMLAKNILARPRMNRVAALTQMVGAFEWQSPEVMTRQAWKRLTAGEKSALAQHVQGAIADAEEASD
jgi:hypothetical protein